MKRMKNGLLSRLSSKRRLAVVGSALTLGALSLAAVALADNVQNDVVAGGNNTFTAGGSTTINYRITANNGDGQTGCNAADGTPATVTINAPAGVTATPGSRTFSLCTSGSTTNAQSVVFSSTTPGDYAITASVSDSNVSGGTYNTSSAAFTLHVLPAPPPTNTPPSVSLTGVTNGASYNKGSVPTATCNVTDTEDGNSSFPATLSAITGPYASDGIGQQTASCSYTDAGGLTASASATYSIVDPSAPLIGSLVTGTLGDNGWYTSDVTLHWTVTELESPNSLLTTGCVDQSIIADQSEQTYTCSASSAGGPAGPESVSIKRDATNPTISGSALPAPNGNGWNNTNVGVTFTCGDNLSGVASCGPDQTLTSEGAGQSVGGTAKDNAGNPAQATVSGINIDKSAPSVSVTGVSNGATYIRGSVPTAGCDTQDSLSGVQTPASLTMSGPGTTNPNGVGSFTAACGGAKDNADNPQAAASVTYSVIYDPAGISGILQPINPDNTSVFSRGKAVPVKFRLAGDEPNGFAYSGWTIQRIKVSCTSFDTEDALPEAVPENPSNAFRYDAGADQYINNASFKDQAAGTCWKVRVTLDSLQTMDSAVFKLQK
jgi:hypothetical protein